MDVERKAMQIWRRRGWHSRCSRSTPNRSSVTPPRARSRVVNAMNSARRLAIPPYSGYNIVDWHIYSRLTSLWKAESQSWSEGERLDFVEWVSRARVTERENSMLDHPLAEYMRCNAPSWGHFVILRVMFGASQCARQSWWADFKEKYERAGEDALPGVVPRDVNEVLQTNRMEPPPIMNIPTMEVNNVHVESDCGCSWCLKKAADKANRGSISSSQESKPAKREQGRKCPRGESIFTGEGETYEDRARRSEREQGVEPEEAQDDDDESEEDEFTGVVTQASSLRERSTLVCTDGANRSLREVVVEQGSMIETLVRLLERQHKRMARLEKRVDKGQRRSEGLYRDVNRRVKDVQRAMRECGEGEEV
ncbi:hypothetical protein GGI35DRAFT_231796 [Trichoderma velutinum]